MRAQTNSSQVFILILLTFYLSCSQEVESDSKTQLDGVPIAEISLISEFDKSGEHYFQSLTLETSVLPDGDIIIYDGAGNFGIQVNENGEFIKQISRQGNGPGEIQSLLTAKSVNDSSLLIYDQERKTVIRKDLDSSNVEEYSPRMRGNLRVIGAYPTADENIINLLWWDMSFLMMEGEESATIFKSYNVEKDKILNRVDYPGETRARTFEDGRVIGAPLVPYSPDLLHHHSPIDHLLYVFWSDDYEIAVLDPVELDTMRTVPVDLPSERLTNTERDSLKNGIRSSDWDAVENMLPDRKTPAEKLMIDHENRIWLKLTLQSEHQEWIVLDQAGEPIMRVQFPKEGFVTHISEHHVGFRADDHLFAVYELKE